MPDNDQHPRFFLGANTPQGFVSKFDQLDYHDDDWHVFIIKGGPGCGKSSLMKKVAQLFSMESPEMELIPCSSDVHSLDAVILPEWKASIVDGTSPHVLEPTYPAASQSILSLGDYLDPMILKGSRSEIKRLSLLSSRGYQNAILCLSAAEAFLNDSRRIVQSCADADKIAAYAQRLANKLLSRHPHNKKPTEKIRFLSSISADGLTLLSETATTLCDNIYFIQDDYGAVSGTLLATLRDAALAMGHDVITCPCCMKVNQIDHLFIPDAGVGFMTENHFHDVSNIVPTRRIHARRFMDWDCLRCRRKRLAFHQKAAAQLIDQAIVSLKEIKGYHDQLEEIYQRAMNYTPLDSVLNSVESDIRRFRFLFK